MSVGSPVELSAEAVAAEVRATLCSARVAAGTAVPGSAARAQGHGTGMGRLAGAGGGDHFV